jgi:transposase-like protein
MTAPDKPALRAVDWAAIRRDYEEGDELVRDIAARHGIGERTILARRRKEDWLTRHNRARLRRGLAALQPSRKLDWQAMRAEYENGQFQVEDIWLRHGIGQSRLYRQARAENWIPRQPNAPRAYGSGRTVNTTERLRALVAQALAELETRRKLGEKIDTDDAMRGLHTLASLTVKILDIEHREKAHDDGDRSTAFLIIDDASRLALAQRLEALVQQWEDRRETDRPDGTGISPA